MDRAAFDTYIETQLAPVLEPGTVIRRANDPPDRWLILRISGQPGHPQKPQIRSPAETAELLVPVFARLLTRPEPDRDGLLQTQSPSQALRGQDLRHPHPSPRQHLRPVQP